MLAQKWEPGSLLPYPFTNDEIKSKNERQPIAPKKEVVLKSQLLTRAQMESQAAEDLFRVCCDMITQHGFHVSKDDFTAPAYSSTTHSELNAALRDNNIRITVEASELFQVYKSEQNAHPVRRADDIIRFMQELVAVRRELYFQYDGYQIGQDGEDAVMRYLEQLAEVDSHILCDNVILNKQVSGHIAQTSEIDTCVITERGIVLCEIKNKFTRGSKKITVSKAGRWEELDKKMGDLKVPAQSPIEQNNIHDRDLRKFLKNHGYGFVNTIPVIVIANTNVEVVNYSQNKVIYTSELDNIFRNNRNPVCLTREQMEDIARLLRSESESVEERAFPLETITGIADGIIKTLTQYLHDYEEEKKWEQENTQTVLNLVNHIREQRERAILALKQKQVRRRGSFIKMLSTILFLIAFFLVAMRVVFGTFSVFDCVRLLPYKLDGEGIFCNYFGSTAVLTNWPIYEYNGQKYTDEWTVTYRDNGYLPYSAPSFEYITTLIIPEDIYPQNMEEFFAGLPNLERIEGIENLHLDRVNSLRTAFRDCKNLTNIVGLSNWDVSSIENMAYLFSGCTSLQNIDDISAWDVSNVSTMEGMFYGCTNLQNIDALAMWNVSEVSNIASMFWGCTDLGNIDALSAWNVSNITSMERLFYGCEKLDHLKALSGWDVSNVSDMSGMFAGCVTVETLDPLADWDVSNVAYMSNMFSARAILDHRTINDEFTECSNLQDIHALSKWNVSHVMSMVGMFSYCNTLQDISALSAWDVSNVISIEEMFAYCSELEDICALSGWNVCNVESMTKLFQRCTSLYNIHPIAGWDVSFVDYMQEMFRGCTSLQNVDSLSAWDVSNVKNMWAMFGDCSSLQNVHGLFNWDVSNVEDMGYMFAECDKLDSLPTWYKE